MMTSHSTPALSTANSKSSSSAPSLPFLTLDEIAKHNTPSSCWLIISECVYDVTEFLQLHPAGSRILLLHGGRDCTSSFLDVHSSSYLTQFLPKESLVGRVVKKNATIDAAAAGGVGSGSGDKILKAIGEFRGRYFPPDSILSLPRTVYTPTHESYRLSFRAYIRRHIHPHYHRWEKEGQPDVEVLRQLFDEGYYLRLSIPKQYGGLSYGVDDWRYHAIITEELENSSISSFFLNLGNDMVLSYFTKNMLETQKEYWLPYMVKQRSIIGIAMSEPEVGSDLAALSTKAVYDTEKKQYVLNGRKMWISAGAIADLVVISAVTNPKAKSNGISLFVVEKGTPGFECAKRLAKLGKHASDTALLTLTDVIVPERNLIGREGEGFKYMMQNLSKERLSIAVGSIAAARVAFSTTLNYVNGRQMFGGILSDMQSVQQTLTKLRVQLQLVTSYVDECIVLQSHSRLTSESASLAKVAATELSCRISDECLQLYGGYGYLKQNPVGKIWQDQRVTKIYGGANEVLLEVVGKGLGFRPQRMYRSAL